MRFAPLDPSQLSLLAPLTRTQAQDGKSTQTKTETAQSAQSAQADREALAVTAAAIRAVDSAQMSGPSSQELARNMSGQNPIEGIGRQTRVGPPKAPPEETKEAAAGAIVIE